MGRGILFAVALSACACLLASAARLNMGQLVPGAKQKAAPAANAPKFVALTFDDGPDSKYTMQVARILEQQGIRGTFFVVGNRVRRYPEQVRALNAAGHGVENHSWTHPDFTKLSNSAKRDEIRRTSDELAKLGIKPRWFRPPYGAFDRATLTVCRDCGLEPMLWSVDPRDWQLPGASTITSRVTSGCGNGSVILLHSNNAQTVEALPAIISELAGRGYTFVTLADWERLALGQSVELPTGEPPSIRVQQPGAEPALLPEVPDPPQGTGAKLADAEDQTHPVDAQLEHPEIGNLEQGQSADPAWVQSMSQTFYEPFTNADQSGPDAAGPALQSAAVQPSPYAELPLPYARAYETRDSVLRGAWDLLAYQRGYADRVRAPQLPAAAPLRVYGNFGNSDEAAGMLESRRGGSVRQLR